jgi:hypothetical protein
MCGWENCRGYVLAPFTNASKQATWLQTRGSSAPQIIASNASPIVLFLAYLTLKAVELHPISRLQKAHEAHTAAIATRVCDCSYCSYCSSACLGITVCDYI